MSDIRSKTSQNTKQNTKRMAIPKCGFVVLVSAHLLFGLPAQGLGFGLGPDFDHIVVYGEGEVTATPDMAEFSAGIEQAAESAKAAKEAVDRVVSAFIQGLKAASVAPEQMQSSNLYLSPRYQYPDDAMPRLVGYQASRTVTVQVADSERLNDFLDIALDAGINQVHNIQFKVQDENKYPQQARLAAIADAQQKARALAAGFGRKLGRLWRIDYENPDSSPLMLRNERVQYSSAADAGYKKSEIVIRDRVRAIYRLAGRAQ